MRNGLRMLPKRNLKEPTRIKAEMSEGQPVKCLGALNQNV